MSPPGALGGAFLEDPISAGDLPEWVLAYARRERLFTPGDRVLVAVSGGPDSVALLHLLLRLAPELSLDLGVAHFDHGLRGEDSRGDAGFVADLARRLGLPCHLGRGEVKAAARRDKVSIQMAARKLRLQFFQETCRGHGYARLALGHTADDQVELFWLRLLRGAGLEGLKGMWPATPEGLVRPLLAVGKAVLLAWLEQEGLPYRVDASNLSRAYLRNRVRLDLLPHLTRGYNPRLAQTIWRTQTLLQEDERLLAREAAVAWDRVARKLAEDCFALDLNRFFSLEPALQTRVLREGVAGLGAGVTLTAPQVASLMALAGSERSGGLISLGEKGEGKRPGGPGRSLFAYHDRLAGPTPGSHPVAGLPGRGGDCRRLALAGVPAPLPARRPLAVPGGGLAEPGPDLPAPDGAVLAARRPLLAPGRPGSQKTPGFPGGRQNSPLASASPAVTRQRRRDCLGGGRENRGAGEGP